MNMFKKNGGFTLVELIVVIAILAILAGVAVPAYSGYIGKANEAADMTQLDAIKTAAVFAYVDKYGATSEVDSITVTVVADADPSTDGNQPGLTVVAEGQTVDITPYYTFTGFKSGATGAVWNGGAWSLTNN